MDVNQESLKLHEELRGKIEVVARRHIETRDDLSLLYTPGVAEPCREIAKDYEKSFTLTRRSNLVAVITDGSAVLGLGDIGPAAGMPVMEGKCALFKEFGGVDAFPICVDTKDVDKLVETIALISKSFGGINLEDIAAPRCFEVERRLKEVCDIPVFHDDQHGTAIVVAAALLNAMRVTGKQMGQMKIVINGAGAAGIAIGKLLISMGFGNIVMCDINGIICEGDEGLNAGQEEISHISNRNHEHGALADALRGADAFVGVSRPNLVTAEMVSTMKDGIVFAMANPTPEIMPDEAKRGGAAVVGTGRSDFPNQINNVMVFPGIFKGALAVRAREITEGMKIRAARALAALVTDEQLSADYILPSALDKSVADTVAHAVAQEHIEGAVIVLEPGPCVAGYGLAVLLFGGHPGHGHQRLALYQHQPVPAALIHGPEGEVHQLGKLGCPLLGAEGGQPRPLQLQAEVPGLVVIGGQAAIDALGGQVLPQALFPHRVGHQLRPQLGSRRVQHPGQLGILAAHR